MHWQVMYLNMFGRKKVNYSYSRAFVCKAFVHMPKFESKAVECIFWGFRDNKFGYRLWDLKSKKLIWSRDAVL